MIRLLLILPIALLVGYTCSRGNKAFVSVSTPAIVPDTTIRTMISFDADIKPIFQTHCNPCHFPGGKMYDKLPFDKAQTIRDHSEGILKRIKNEEEVKKLKAFLAQVE